MAHFKQMTRPPENRQDDLVKLRIPQRPLPVGLSGRYGYGERFWGFHLKLCKDAWPSLGHVGVGHPTKVEP
jgi:hypothetical protein